MIMGGGGDGDQEARQGLQSIEKLPIHPPLASGTAGRRCRSVLAMYGHDDREMGWC